ASTIMSSIRARLSLFVGGVALLTVLAAGGILLAVRVSDDALARLAASQRRLDLLTESSARLTDYALAAIDGINASSLGHERLAALKERAEATFASIDATRASEAGL